MSKSIQQRIPPTYMKIGFRAYIKNKSVYIGYPLSLVVIILESKKAIISSL